MAVVTPIDTNKHPFLTGKAKRLFIDGKWVEAASGKTFEANFNEMVALDTLDMGAPITRTNGSRLRALGMLRYYAGQATSIHGETIENSLPGEYVSFTLNEPVGVVGAIIPWNGH